MLDIREDYFFKSISNAKLGTIKIAFDQNEVLICLQDICQLFCINYQETIVKLNPYGIKEFPMIVEKKIRKKLFITMANLEKCLSLSKEVKADAIYNWIRNAVTIRFNGYTIEDLKNDAKALEVLKKIEELEATINIQNEKIKEDALKVKFIDELYGSRAPIDFSLVPDRIKYRGLSLAKILEDLRLTGIFNADNTPNQSYIDSRHFRLVTAITTIETTEVKLRKVLVYQSGLHLIEEILKKKAGSRNVKKE